MRSTRLTGVVALGLLVGCPHSSSSPPAEVARPSPAAVSQPASAAASAPASQPASRAASRAADGRARLEKSEAGKLALSAIDAHGGLAAWFAQGAISFRYDYRPLKGGTRRTSVQTVDVLGSRVYHSFEAPAKGQIAFDGEKAWMKLEGDAKLDARFWALTPYYFVAMPFVLGDPGVRLELIGDDPKDAGVEDSHVIKVTFAAGTGDAPDDYYIVYISKRTRELVALRYVVSYAPFFVGKDTKHTPEKLLVYGDYETEGGLKIARSEHFFAFVDGHRGEAVTEATVTEVQVGAPFDESRLAMPEGGTVDAALP